MYKKNAFIFNVLALLSSVVLASEPNLPNTASDVAPSATLSEDLLGEKAGKEAGCEPTTLGDRYTDNGDGTVLDHRTCLIWLKDRIKMNIPMNISVKIIPLERSQIGDFQRFKNCKVSLIMDFLIRYSPIQKALTNGVKTPKRMPFHRCNWIYTGQQRPVRLVQPMRGIYTSPMAIPVPVKRSVPKTMFGLFGVNDNK